MKILFLTTVIPKQKRMGSEVASQCFIDALECLGYQVSVVGYMRQDDVFELQSQEILVGKRYIETKKARFYPLIWFLLSILLGLPYSAAKYHSRVYIKTVKQLLSQDRYDVVIIDHPQLGWLTRFLGKNTNLVMIAHNIEHEIYRDRVLGTMGANYSSLYQKGRNWLAGSVYRREGQLIQEMEDNLATTAQEVWVLTEHDSKYFARLPGVGKVRTSTLPPGLQEFRPKAVSKTFDIGMIGSWSWQPNQEGLQWFLQRVYPLLPQDLSIHIAGRGADWLVEEYPQINYRGFVPDAQEFMAAAKVVAIPILSGGGIQIKTLDAIASGSAIVATPVSLRGIANPPTTVQIAQQPAEFARLLQQAIAAEDPQTTNEASAWLSQRQEQFVVDIAEAIRSLTPTTKDR